MYVVNVGYDVCLYKYFGYWKSFRTFVDIYEVNILVVIGGDVVLLIDFD